MAKGPRPGGGGGGGGKGPKPPGGRGRQPGQPPKLTDDSGVPKKDDQIKGEIAGWLKEEIEAERLKRELNRFLERRNIRQALGVGDVATFIKEFEGGFKNSAKETKPQLDDEGEAAIYGEAKENRPKVKKISQEWVLDPDDKGQGKGKGKGGKK